MFNTYTNYLNYLKENSSLKLKDFSTGLIQTKYIILGIKIPFLRNLAKKIIFENEQDLILNNLNFTYFEEILLYSFVLALIKISEEERINKIYNFLPYIDNWGVCDSFCSSLKVINKNKDTYLKFIEKILKTNKLYFQRVGIVLLMNYYLNETELEYYFNLVTNVKIQDYYIQMAKAWYFATSLAKNYNQTLKFLKLNKHNLSKEVLKKIISKCNDSFRLTKEQKVEIKKTLNLN